MIVDKPTIVGVLALQGSFKEHADKITDAGIEVRFVRCMNDTKNLTSFIVPGGESTTQLQLLKKTGLDQWIKDMANRGLPIFGTCAGMIVLKELGLLNVQLERNAYGPQISSFETMIDFQTKDFPAVFIRAPKMIDVGSEVEVLAKVDKTPVLVKQRNLLAGSFHPELTNNPQIHEYFLTF